MTIHEINPERPHMNEAQETALHTVCDRYNVEFRHEHYGPVFDLAEGWVAGWIGGQEIQQTHPTIYVGCSPEGEVSS